MKFDKLVAECVSSKRTNVLIGRRWCYKPGTMNCIMTIFLVTVLISLDDACSPTPWGVRQGYMFPNIAPDLSQGNNSKTDNVCRYFVFTGEIPFALHTFIQTTII